MMWREKSSATWQHMRLPHVTHVYMCACVCACVYVNKEKAPCLGFSLTPHLRTPYIHARFLDFFHVGLCFVLNACK